MVGTGIIGVMGVNGRRPVADADELADAVLTASRNLVQATAAALVELAPALNLTDFRVLGLLEERGPVRLTDIAEALQVTGTTATRLADRLHGVARADRAVAVRILGQLGVGPATEGRVTA